MRADSLCLVIPFRLDWEKLTAIESELQRLMSAEKAGEFEGNEVGSESVRLYFTVTRLERFLLTSYKVLNAHGLGDADVQIEGDGANANASLAKLLELGKVRRRQTKGRSVELFDYFGIPLSNGKFGCVQYIAQILPWGDFISILDLITDKIAEPSAVLAAKPRFQPILTSVKAVSRQGAWRLICNDVPECAPVLPLFRYTMEHVPGTYDTWCIYDLNRNSVTEVGRLTSEQRGMEFLGVWNAGDIHDRILTGRNRYDEFL